MFRDHRGQASGYSQLRGGDNGEVLIEHGWPAKGTTHVSNGIRRGRPSK